MPASHATVATWRCSAQLSRIRARSACLRGRLRSVGIAANRARSSADTRGQTARAIRRASPEVGRKWILRSCGFSRRRIIRRRRDARRQDARGRASRTTAVSRSSVGRLFSEASPALTQVSRRRVSSAAVTANSRDTSCSMPSSRSRRHTALCLGLADIRRFGPGVGPSPPPSGRRCDGQPRPPFRSSSSPPCSRRTSRTPCRD